MLATPGAAIAQDAGSTDGPPTFVGEALAKDGDTLIMDGRDLRLYGMWAPEAGKDRAHCSTAMFDDLTARSALRCIQFDYDKKYKRPVVVCLIDNDPPINVGSEIIRSGWAFVYRHFARDPASVSDKAFYEAERDARANKRGFWVRITADVNRLDFLCRDHYLRI